MQTIYREDYEYLFKLIIVGDASAGKTSLLIRYTKNVVQKSVKPTIGVEYMTKNITLKNSQAIIKAQIWDTSGQEIYRSITAAKSAGAIIIFDLTNLKSFENLTIQDQTDENIQIILIGNKLDLIQNDPNTRAVNEQMIQQFCQKYNLQYFETSATNGYNVKESFEFLVEQGEFTSQKNIDLSQKIKNNDTVEESNHKCC